MSLSVSGVIEFLETLAEPRLAEEWDNVGLLLGDGEQAIGSVMTCLTLTSEVAEEAIRRRVGLVVTHHPILFRAVKRLTTETSEGRMLLELIRSSVAVYSPHTAFDNGIGGINRWLAKELGLENIAPLRPRDDSPSEGTGRMGDLKTPLSWLNFQKHLAAKLSLTQFQAVDTKKPTIRRVGIACGAAGDFLRDAHHLNCDVFLTGEARFHTCLEAKTLGIGLVLLGHYASERPAMEMLAQKLSEAFPAIEVWASEAESDPLNWSRPAQG
jgi:dinuclear metal center YbgI/SA1388 family protein